MALDLDRILKDFDNNVVNDSGWRKNRNLTCPKCRLVFQTRPFFEDHVKNCTENRNLSATDIRCEFCKLVLHDEAALKTHMLLIHKSNYLGHFKEPFKKLCVKKKRRNSRNLGGGDDENNNDKMKNRTRILEKRVQCEICFRSFSKHYIKNHIASFHEGRRDYECPICLKVYSTKNNLHIHTVSIHFGRKTVKRFKCELCDRLCRDKNELGHHIAANHTTIKKFQCPGCLKRYKSKQTILKHRKKNCRQIVQKKDKPIEK